MIKWDWKTFHILAIILSFLMILEHSEGDLNLWNNIPLLKLWQKIQFWVTVDPSLHSTTITMRLSLSKGTETFFFPLPNKRRNWMKYLWSSMYSMNSFRTMRFWISFFFCVYEQYITHEYCENVAYFTIHFYVSIVYTYISYIYVIVKHTPQNAY